MTPRKKYWILSTLLNFLGLPLTVTAVTLLSLMALSHIPDVQFPVLVDSLVLLPGIALACAAAFWYGYKASLPDTFLSRYMPFIAPILYILAIRIALGFLMQGYFWEEDISIEVLSITAIAFAPHFMLAMFMAMAMESFEGIPFILIALHALFLLLFALGAWKRGCLATRGNQRAIHVLAPIAALVVIILGYQLYEWKAYHLSDEQKAAGGDSLPPYEEDSVAYDTYMPFRKESQLTALRQKPAIQFKRDYPRLDGATAFFPVYAAAAQAIYLEPEEEKDKVARFMAIRFSRTPGAYENLISGVADLIFALAPSEEQKKHAVDNNLTLTLTPIAREAFVFLVNAQNPVKDLRLDEIRAIYSGKINKWSKVGGTNEKIIPFQRPKNSGSQTILLQEVMRGEPVRKPMRETVVEEMVGMLYRVAGYYNLTNAIGYSFRYYAQTMRPTPGIRLLSIDGVAPTPENIRARRYPLTVDVYMVTARPLSGNAQKLHDWFLSPEGQQLIEDVGYVPIPMESRFPMKNLTP
ncbi:MAG: substrate-binding domain-containing protein [Zoogloeaceae bacterium]|jgi:phosphate transport system substrate-binding protein|nr:substrate-binding domain-containing protein [Zoogloeaceae bacterium]